MFKPSCWPTFKHPSLGPPWFPFNNYFGPAPGQVRIYKRWTSPKYWVPPETQASDVLGREVLETSAAVNQPPALFLAVPPFCSRAGWTKRQDQGKILHTRSHKHEHPLENATENPLDNSSKIPQVTIPRKTPLTSEIPLANTSEMPLIIHEDFRGVDFWRAIFCPWSDGALRCLGSGASGASAPPLICIYIYICVYMYIYIYIYTYIYIYI